jgi:signal transduction histidine kinase
MHVSYIISCALTGILSLLLGIFIYIKNRESNINKIGMLLSLTISLWSWSLFARELSSEKNTALFFVRLCYIGVIPIPAFFLHFVSSLTKQVKNKLLFFIYFLSFIFLISDFTPLFIKEVRPILSFRYYGTPGIFFPFYVFLFISIAVYSHYILIKYFKKSEGQTRNQIKYLLFATGIGFLGGGSTFLPTFNIELFPYGFYLVSIYVLITYYAIVKHRLMDINVVLKKGTTYGLLLVVLFIPSFLLIIFGQKLFYDEINYYFLCYLFVILLLVAIFFYWIKPGTERAVEQLLFKRHYDYRETLRRFSKAMVTILDLKSLSEKTIETITETMGVEKASLFLSDEEKGGFRLFESKNLIAAPTLSFLSRGNPFLLYLHRSGEIIIREELTKGADPELKDVTRQMSLLEAEVSIPLVWKGQLIGMINLSHKFNKEIYSHEDLELLSTLANQVAISMENARLYEDLKKSKSYIRRADRLASLGTLTAGISHEIRNPLVAIKTFTQLLPERLKDEEFLNKFLGIASGEVDRISSLITELLEFAKPSEPKLELEDVNTILDSMILLLSTESSKKLIQLIKQYGTDLPPIRIDREQMKQAFLNILLNAIEATPENGKVMVSTRSFIKPGGQPYIQIEVSDTGCGIAAENLEEIFNPFFTTKEMGSGLGLSIAHQIVQEHKGYITVESQLDQGSSFYINLPLSQDHPQRRKGDNVTFPELS